MLPSKIVFRKRHIAIETTGLPTGAVISATYKLTSSQRFRWVDLQLRLQLKKTEEKRHKTHLDYQVRHGCSVLRSAG